MSETILRFSIAELKTIRVKIGQVITELPLESDVVAKFAKEQVQQSRMSYEDQQSLVGMVHELQAAKKMLDNMTSIEFVLPSE